MLSEIFIECAMKKPENPYVFVANELYRLKKVVIIHFMMIFCDRRANEAVTVIDVGAESVTDLDCLAPKKR